MEHPVVHRLLRKGFESWWNNPSFLQTYFMAVSMISSVLDYVHALDVSSRMPPMGNLQELINMLSFELVQCLGEIHSKPSFLSEDPDEGWWRETTRLQLEGFLNGYINLFTIQNATEQAKMKKQVNAMKTHLEYCTNISNDELWADLLQWSRSLYSLQASIAWDEHPFPNRWGNSQRGGSSA